MTEYVEIAFKLGRADAELEARTLANIDPVAGQRSQWEAWTERIEGLGRREALIKTPFVSTTALRTLEVRDTSTVAHKLQTVLSEYARIYHRLPPQSRKEESAGDRTTHDGRERFRRMWT